MQIFYDKIQGLTVEPTDSIQHVKDIIEVCSLVHTLLNTPPCNMRLCEAHTYLTEQSTGRGAICVPVNRLLYPR